MLIQLVVVGFLMALGASLIGATLLLTRLIQHNAAAAAQLADRRAAAEQRLREWEGLLDRSQRALPPDWLGEHLARGRSALERSRRAAAILRELDALRQNAGLNLPPNPSIADDLRRWWRAPGARLRLRRLEQTADVLQQALEEADRAFAYLLGERFELARRAAQELQPALERLRRARESGTPTAPGWAARLALLEQEFHRFRDDLFGSADRPPHASASLQRTWRALEVTAAALEAEHRRAEAESRQFAEAHDAIARRLQARRAAPLSSGSTAAGVRYLLEQVEVALRTAVAQHNAAHWSHGLLWLAHAERYEAAALALEALAPTADALQRALPDALPPVAADGDALFRQVRQTLQRLYAADLRRSAGDEATGPVDEAAARGVEQATAELAAQRQQADVLLARQRADGERLNRLATAEQQALRAARRALLAVAPLRDDLLRQRADDQVRRVGAVRDRPRLLQDWLAEAAALRKQLDHTRGVLTERRQAIAQALQRLDGRIRKLLMHAEGWRALNMPAAELQAGYKELDGLAVKALHAGTVRQCEVALDALRGPLATLTQLCDRLEAEGSELGDLYEQMFTLRQALRSAGKRSEDERDHMVSYYFRRACAAEQTAEARVNLQEAVDLLKKAL